MFNNLRGLITRGRGYCKSMVLDWSIVIWRCWTPSCADCNNILYYWSFSILQGQYWSRWCNIELYFQFRHLAWHSFGNRAWKTSPLGQTAGRDNNIEGQNVEAVVQYWRGRITKEHSLHLHVNFELWEQSFNNAICADEVAITQYLNSWRPVFNKCNISIRASPWMSSANRCSVPQLLRLGFLFLPHAAGRGTATHHAPLRARTHRSQICDTYHM